MRALLQAAPLMQDVAPDLSEWKLPTFCRPDYIAWAARQREYCAAATTDHFEAAVQDAKEKVYLQALQQERMLRERAMEQNAQLIQENRRMEAFYIRQLCAQQPGMLHRKRIRNRN